MLLALWGDGRGAMAIGLRSQSGVRRLPPRTGSHQRSRRLFGDGGWRRGQRQSRVVVVLRRDLSSLTLLACLPQLARTALALRLVLVSQPLGLRFVWGVSLPRYGGVFALLRLLNNLIHCHRRCAFEAGQRCCAQLRNQPIGGRTGRMQRAGAWNLLHRLFQILARIHRTTQIFLGVVTGAALRVLVALGAIAFTTGSTTA
mmetsp:Transcript_44522/g.83131  ORF Transcript_44522/g.83131 Transcript_44522/m.83131 type:complete len:201 (-) Transcript_44522:395-997(-)